MPATRPMDRRPGAPESRPSEASKQGFAGQSEAKRSDDSRADTALERASRALSALDPEADGEVGTRLQELRDALVRGAADGDPRAQRLLSRLDAMAFQPGRDGGPELAVLNRMSQVARQLALLASATIAGVDSVEAAKQALLDALLASASVSSGSSGGRAVAAGLEELLAETVGRSAGIQLRAHDAADVLREASARLLGALVDRLESAKAGGAAASLRAALAGRTSRSAIDGALARVLLHQQVSWAGGSGQASAYLDSLLHGALRSPQEVAAAMVAESGTADRALRDIIGRHLAAREFEHAWNVVRREFGDPPAFGFAVPEGPDGFATVQVIGDQQGERGGGGGERTPGSCHVTVGVEFSGLGPVRADLAVRDDQVALRMVVARPEVAQELRFRAKELESSLALEGRRVLLAIADGSEEEARVDARRVGLKPEDHVMDLEG